MSKYVYSFSVWPGECRRGRQNSPALYKVFESIGARIEDTFTEPEFNEFRSNLNADGFTLQEIERVPYCKPEHVW